MTKTLTHQSPLGALEIPTVLGPVEPGEPFEVEDLVTGQVWTWTDHDYVRLDAFAEPVHILAVKERS